MGYQAITRPSGAGKVDVVLVDGHGETIRVLVPHVDPVTARRLILRRHH